MLKRTSRKAVAAVAGMVVAAGIATAGVATANAETERSEVARETHAEEQVPGTPCSVSARACVDLESQRAWLIKDGKVEHGPIAIASGGAGKETPVGHSFRVYRTEAHHESSEHDGPDGRPAEMPWSVFFADGGVAFHGGDRSRASAGCVKLDSNDAQRFFTTLDVGDKVQVLNASTEQAERAKLAER